MWYVFVFMVSEPIFVVDDVVCMWINFIGWRFYTQIYNTTFGNEIDFSVFLSFSRRFSLVYMYWVQSLLTARAFPMVLHVLQCVFDFDWLVFRAYFFFSRIQCSFLNFSKSSSSFSAMMLIVVSRALFFPLYVFIYAYMYCSRQLLSSSSHCR